MKFYSSLIYPTTALFVALSVASAIPIETPLQVVQRVRGKYPNLPGNRVITLQALKEIAADPVIKGGILTKTSGNNCGGYSCDIICYQNRNYSDVFIDWENTARASWNTKVASSEFGSRCVMQGAVTPPPTDCTAQEETIRLLRAQNTALQQENQQLKLTANALKEENEKLHAQLEEWNTNLAKCLKDYDDLKKKYDSMTCSASFRPFPCRVNK
jgi:FtsZ-binding cell division protein ZapB